MPLQDSYTYDVTVEWIGRRAGQLSSPDVPPLIVSAPVEFSGQSDEWTPEHLLVAAAASCLMTTFLAVAEISKLPVVSYVSQASAKLEKFPSEGYRFTEVALRPEIHVPDGEAYRALRLLAKAEASCFVSKALRIKVRVEPWVVAEEPVEELAART